MKKILAVFGVTGQQGGALMKAVQNDQILSQTFAIRGITRDASKESARVLVHNGVEIVEADFNKPETLHAALENAYAVFSVTNFWTNDSPEQEIFQGKAVADAARDAGVTLFIWSSLPSVKVMTNGKMLVPHFDTKAEVEVYVRSLHFPSAVFFLPGWFMQNITHPYIPRARTAQNGDMVLPFAWSPDLHVPLIDINDIGKYLKPALLDPGKFDGSRLFASSGYYTASKMVDSWSRICGKGVRWATVTEVDEFSTNSNDTRFLREDDLLTKFGYYGPDGQQQLEWTRSQLLETLNTWEEFLVQNGPWFSTGNEEQM